MGIILNRNKAPLPNFKSLLYIVDGPKDGVTSRIAEVSKLEHMAALKVVDELRAGKSIPELDKMRAWSILDAASENGLKFVIPKLQAGISRAHQWLLTKDPDVMKEERERKIWQYLDTVRNEFERIQFSDEQMSERYALFEAIVDEKTTLEHVRGVHRRMVSVRGILGFNNIILRHALLPLEDQFRAVWSACKAELKVATKEGSLTGKEIRNLSMSASRLNLTDNDLLFILEMSIRKAIISSWDQKEGFDYRQVFDTLEEKIRSLQEAFNILINNKVSLPPNELAKTFLKLADTDCDPDGTSFMIYAMGRTKEFTDSQILELMNSYLDQAHKQCHEEIKAALLNNKIISPLDFKRLYNKIYNSVMDKTQKYLYSVISGKLDHHKRNFQTLSEDPKTSAKKVVKHYFTSSPTP